jgi:hypothetical protein
MKHMSLRPSLIPAKLILLAAVTLPVRGGTLVPGPDVIVGEMPAVGQFGRSGSVVALSVATTSCNKGDENLHWYELPNNDHPVIPQNLYRLKNDRFEQIGQSWVKHAYAAINGDACEFGCDPAGDNTELGPGCSDPYSAQLNNLNGLLGSRAWINPFTGDFTEDAADHGGHTHGQLGHAMRVSDADIAQNLNGNDTALYYAEAQYVTRHEYLPNNGVANNQYNNVSYRQFDVTGNAGSTYSFDDVGLTIQETPAIYAWPGATIIVLEPDPGNDGLAYLAYKVTGPVGGLWHYEYALYNMNLDRSLGSFGVSIDPTATIGAVGFHGPPQHPGFANDGTGGAGYSSTPWSWIISGGPEGKIAFATQTFAANPNANAVRWGTLCNFWFDANRPPVPTAASAGTFKLDGSIPLVVSGPDADCNGNGIGDAQDILSGSSADKNGDGVPDECVDPTCLGDIAPDGGDGQVAVDDLLFVISNWGPLGGGTPADFDDSGSVDVNDLLFVINLWGPCG